MLLALSTSRNDLTKILIVVTIIALVVYIVQAIRHP